MLVGAAGGGLGEEKKSERTKMKLTPPWFVSIETL
jgi:hypothetical protein